MFGWLRLWGLSLVEEFFISFVRNREMLNYLLVAKFIHTLYSTVELSTETEVDQHFAAARDRRFKTRKNAVEAFISKKCFQLGLLLVYLQFLQQSSKLTDGHKLIKKNLIASCCSRVTALSSPSFLKYSFGKSILRLKKQSMSCLGY